MKVLFCWEQNVIIFVCTFCTDKLFACDHTLSHHIIHPNWWCCDDLWLVKSLPDFLHCKFQAKQQLYVLYKQHSNGATRRHHIHSILHCISAILCKYAARESSYYLSIDSFNRYNIIGRKSFFQSMIANFFRFPFVYH